MIRTTTTNGIIRADLDTVTVTYDRQFNLVEVIRDKKVIHCEVAPRNYTVEHWFRTIQKVKDFYSINAN